MFVVTAADAAAVRRAMEEGGDLAAGTEMRRVFPGIGSPGQARECARIIAEWRPPPIAAPRRPARASQLTRRHEP
ncbi:MAG TPA: hypothetical protein VMB21_17040 [Candidatus Limnocylindria bacterium]|jgi:hypothetical protein|nr:hypothetical protein [Candidatus Limnocylindria bacterium]